ncbi:MAG: hypothetical protein JWN41_1653 [Thermoleophilia bacterium]|nr:hypothetical protein [Thermoleophilia bacterium]
MSNFNVIKPLLLSGGVASAGGLLIGAYKEMTDVPAPAKHNGFCADKVDLFKNGVGGLMIGSLSGGLVGHVVTHLDPGGAVAQVKNLGKIGTGAGAVLGAIITGAALVSYTEGKAFARNVMES